jgi:hypothetical protein
MPKNDPPDPYLQWLLNLLVAQMNKSESPFYLPKLILGQRNPTYEPYVIDGEWVIKDQSGLQEAGNTICLATMPGDIAKEYNQGIADTPPLLVLASPNRIDFPGAIPFSVSGISNIIAQNPVVDYGEHATAQATFAQIPTWPHGQNGITVAGNFKINQLCCPSNDAVACAIGGPTWSEASYGTFIVTVKKPQASIAGTAYTDGKYLQLSIEALQVTASTRPEDIDVAITIETITDPNIRKMWQSLANEAVGNATAIQAMLDNLHDILNSENTRRDISNVINENLRKIIDGGMLANLGSRQE